MTDPRVTVVIPTRDRAELLAEAVASVRAQEEPARLVVVDDASRDGTAAWCAGPGAGPDLEVVRCELPVERTRARNLGLARTTTRHVWFLDDDDVLLPGALARLGDALDASPDAVLAAGAYRTFGDHGPHDRARTQLRVRRRTRRPMWREVLWGWYAIPSASLWRADALRAAGGWDESRSFAEDLELLLRIHARPDDAPVVVDPAIVVGWRQHARTQVHDVRAGQLAEEAALRRAHVEDLAGRARRSAEQVLAARSRFDEALTAYGSGHFGAAFVGFLGAIRRWPGVVASPIYGRWLLGLVARAALAAAVPGAWATRLARRREAARLAEHRELQT